MADIQKYRVKSFDSKLSDTAKNPVKQVEVSFIKGAGESQRTAPAFAGKCRLVRRGGERAAGEA